MLRRSSKTRKSRVTTSKAHPRQNAHYKGTSLDAISQHAYIASNTNACIVDTHSQGPRSIFSPAIKSRATSDIAIRRSLYTGISTHEPLIVPISRSEYRSIAPIERHEQPASINQSRQSHPRKRIPPPEMTPRRGISSLFNRNRGDGDNPRDKRDKREPRERQDKGSTGKPGLDELYAKQIEDDLRELQLKQAQTTRYDSYHDENHDQYDSGALHQHQLPSDAERDYSRYNIANEINASHQQPNSSGVYGMTPDGRVKKPSHVRKISIPPAHTSRVKYGDYILFTGAHCSDIFIAIQSNLGDSPLIIREAIDMINDIPHTHVAAVSPMFSTPPKRGTRQPKFSVTIRVSSSVVPKSLVGQLDRIQLDLGKILYDLKEFSESSESRRSKSLRREQTIDINLISYGALSIEERSTDPNDLNIRIPHRSMRNLEVAYGLASLVTIDTTPCPSVYGSLIKNGEYWHPDEHMNLTEMLLLPRKNKPIVSVTPMFPRRDFYQPKMDQLMKNETLVRFIKPENLDLYQFPELNIKTQLDHSKTMTKNKPRRLKHPTRITSITDSNYDVAPSDNETGDGENNDTKEKDDGYQTRLLPPNTLVAAHLQTWPTKQVEEYRIKNQLLLQNDKTIKFATAIDNSRGLTKQLVIVIAGEAFDAITLRPCHRPKHAGIDYLSPDTTLDITHLVPFPLTYLLLPPPLKIAIAQGLSQLQQGVNLINVSAHALDYEVDRTKTIEQMSYSTADVIWYLRQTIDYWNELGQYSEDVALRKTVSAAGQQFTPPKVRIETSRWLEALRVATEAMATKPSEEQLQSQKEGLFTKGFFNLMEIDHKNPKTRTVLINTLLNAFAWDLDHPIYVKQQEVLGHEDDEDSEITHLKLLLSSDRQLKALREQKAHAISTLGQKPRDNQDELLEFLFDSTDTANTMLTEATSMANQGDREYLKQFVDKHLSKDSKGPSAASSRSQESSTILDDIRRKPRKYNHDGDALDLVDPRKVYDTFENEDEWLRANPMNDDDDITDGSDGEAKQDSFESFFNEGETTTQLKKKISQERKMIEDDQDHPYDGISAPYDPSKLHELENPHPDLPFLNQLKLKSAEEKQKQEELDRKKYPAEPKEPTEKDRFQKRQEQIKQQKRRASPQFEEDDLGVLGDGTIQRTRMTTTSPRQQVIDIYTDGEQPPEGEQDVNDASNPDELAILLAKATETATQRVTKTFDGSALPHIGANTQRPLSRKDLLKRKIQDTTGAGGPGEVSAATLGDRDALQHKLDDIDRRIQLVRLNAGKLNPADAEGIDHQAFLKLKSKQSVQDEKIRNIDLSNLTEEDALLFEDIKRELILEKEVQDALVQQEWEQHQSLPNEVKLKQIELIKQHEHILSLPTLNIRRCDTIKGAPYLSIFTCHAPVAIRGVLSGADVIHDFGFAAQDRYMMNVMSAFDIPIIVGHMRGTLQSMNSPRVRRTYKEDKDRIDNEMEQLAEEQEDQDAPSHLYQAEAKSFHNSYLSGIAEDIQKFLFHASRNGIPLYNIIVDPGIGLAKSGLANVTIPNNITALLPSSIPLPMFYSTARLPRADTVLGQNDLAITNSILQKILDTTKHLESIEHLQNNGEMVKRQELSIYKYKNVLSAYEQEQQIIEQSMISTSVYTTPQNGLESMTGGIVGTSSRLAIVEANDTLRARVVIEIGNTVAQMENYARDDIKM